MFFDEQSLKLHVDLLVYKEIPGVYVEVVVEIVYGVFLESNLHLRVFCYPQEVLKTCFLLPHSDFDLELKRAVNACYDSGGH